MRTHTYFRRLVLAAALVAAGTLGASATSPAAAVPDWPAGFDCGLEAATLDSNLSPDQPDYFRGELYWGPFATPGVTTSVACSVRVNNVPKAANGAWGASVMPPGSAEVQFLATRADTVTVCTDVAWYDLNGARIARRFGCDEATASDTAIETEDGETRVARHHRKAQDTTFGPFIF